MAACSKIRTGLVAMAVAGTTFACQLPEDSAKGTKYEVEVVPYNGVIVPLHHFMAELASSEDLLNSRIEDLEPASVGDVAPDEYVMPRKSEQPLKITLGPANTTPVSPVYIDEFEHWA